MMFQVLLSAILIIGLAFIGIALRLIFVKGGEFRGSCASNNPMLKNEIGECTVCGAKPEEECKND